MIQTLLDPGPLIAYFNKSDQWHRWAVAQFKALRPPLITSEAVLTEACFLIRRNGGDLINIFRFLARGIFEVGIHLQPEASALELLMRRYVDTPMSLADASVVRLSEFHPECRVFTLDSDFVHYRRNGRGIIPLLAPW